MKTLINLLFISFLGLLSLNAQQRITLAGQAQATDVSNPQNNVTYFFGGQSGPTNFTNVLYKLDGTGQLQFVEPDLTCPQPTPRAGATAWFDNGSLYIRGGFNSTVGCMGDTWVFNTTTKCWALLLTGDPCVAYMASVKVPTDNKVYLVGGRNAAGESLPHFYSMNLGNPGAGYTTLPALPEPLAGPAVLHKNGKTLVFGGLWHDWDPNTPGNQPSYSQNIWRYSPTAKAGWDMVPATGEIIELYRMAYTQDPLGNFFYVFGGRTYNYTTNSEFFSNGIYKFNLNTNVWTKVPVNLPVALADFTASYRSHTGGNDTIYLIGGQLQNGTLSNTSYKFSVLGNTLTPFVVTSTPEITVEKAGLSIYPNPGTDIINFQCKEPINAANLTFYNAFGQQMIINKDYSGTSVNVVDFPAGLYFVELGLRDKTLKARFVKK
ncbi:MAG: T9SS type A sorting domain-containing protein [Bacteroidia bacterium]|nr:T9SS type A sorting domain-containing protein [Bacteroidia bacterium]